MKTKPQIGHAKLLIAVGCMAATWTALCAAQAEALRETTEAVRQKFPNVQQLSTKELAQWMSNTNTSPPLLLDTREPEEYAVSHIPGARLAASNSDLRRNVAEIDKHRVIVTYCSVGYRSSKAARKLQRMGYTNVYNLEGSLFKWANEGRALVRDGKPVNEVHPFNAQWGRLLDSELRKTLTTNEHE